MSSSVMCGSSEVSVAYHLHGERKIECKGQFECYLCGVRSTMKENMDSFLGRILTIIDASISDKRQNEALKDIIRPLVYEKMGDIEGGVSFIVANAGLDEKRMKDAV